MSRKIRPVVPSDTIYQRQLNENARAELADAKAIQDYNIMMGILEDPSEDDEEEGE